MAKKVGFLNFYLNAQDRQQAEELEGEPHFLTGTIEHLGVTGHKVSFNFKSQWGSWVVSVTTESKANSNHKYILSDFGKTPENALARVWFYHSYICADMAWEENMSSIKEFSDS